MTIALWFKATSFVTNQRLFCKGFGTFESPDTGGACSYFIRVASVSGTYRLGVGLRTGTTTTYLNGASLAVSTGVVYLVFLWYDGTNLRIYYNAGVQEATTAKTGNVNINSNHPVYLACHPGFQIKYTGIIDDVRVYTRALSIPEMQTIYYSEGQDTIVDDLYARWKMDENYIGRRSSLSLLKELKDDSGNGFNAVSEDAGYALSFNGSSNKVEFASVNSDFQLVAPFTIEAWVKPKFNYTAWAAGVYYSVNSRSSYGGFGYICIQAHTSQVGWEPPNVPALWGLDNPRRFFGSRNGNNGVGVGVYGGTGLRLTTYGKRDWTTTSGYLSYNTWTHVAFVFQNYSTGKQVLFYVDGSLVQTVSDAAATDPGTSLSTAHLGFENTEWWNGSIDLFRIYKGEARSAANILLYMNEHPPSSTNLKVFTKLNDASGSSAADVSSNNHTGTLTECTWEESGAWENPTYAEPLNHKPT